MGGKKMEATALLLIFTCFVGLVLTHQRTIHEQRTNKTFLQWDEFSKAFPCPTEEDIHPCICTYNSDDETLSMNCSAVTNETELEEVFSAPIPDTAFTQLIIEDNQYLTFLGDVFGDVTFKRVFLENMENLSFISESSLFGSRYTLEILEIVGTSELDMFTIPIMTFGLYTNLHRLRLSGNGQTESFPFLESNHLTYIEIFNWDITSLPVDAYYGVPMTSVIGAHDLGLHEVIPGTFDGLHDLAHVNLGQNAISRLLPGTLIVTNLTNYINFGYNIISTVDVGTFIVEHGAGSLGNVEVYFNDNQITSLDSDVWQPLVYNITSFDLRGNPLTCGCDLAWLVLDPDLMAKVHPNSTCNDGTPLHDLDPTPFADLC